MSLHSFFSPISIGLDIQPDYICLVQCKKLRQGYLVIDAAITNTPEGVFQEGKIVAWDSLQLALTTFVTSCQADGKAIVSLPTQLVRMQTMQLPADLTDDEIETEINLQIQRDMPGMADVLVVDFVATPAINSGHMDVFFAATRQEYLYKYIECLKASALQVNIVDVDVYAIQRALYYSLPHHALSTELNVILYLTKHNALLLASDSWNVLYHQQWDRKINTPDQIIQLCINSLRHIKPNTLIICGASECITAFSTNMDKYVAQKYSLQFHVLDPFKKMHINKLCSEKIKNDPSQFLTACGLAMHGTNKMVEINLLPWRVSQKLYAKKLFIKIMLFTSMMTILILAAGYYFLHLKQINIKEEISRFQEREQRNLQEATRMQENETQPINNELLKEFMQRKYILRSLFIHLSKVHTYHICFSQIKQEGKGIIFSGLSPTALDFTEFITKWDGAKLFSEIEIKQLRKNPDSNWVEFDFYAI